MLQISLFPNNLSLIRKTMNLFCMILTFIACCNYALAQDNTKEASKASIDETKLLGKTRSEIFVALRSERTKIIRKLEKMETRQRDIILEISTLNNQKKNLESKLGVSQPQTLSPEIIEINDKIRRQISEKENVIVRMNSRKKIEEARLKSLRKSNSIDEELGKKILDIQISLNSMPFLIEERIKELESEIGNLEGKKKDLEENIKKNKDWSEKKAAELNKDINLINQKISSIKIESEKLPIEIENSRILLDSINQRIVRLIDVSDSEGFFKLWISLTFAGLVSFVIVGFFFVIKSNSSLIFEIFSKDFGIQFITLFSIVIAVILFGIIEVLEGKELAALLGGLSGYILGRGASSEGRKSKEGSDAEGQTGSRPSTQDVAAEQIQTT